MNLTLKPRIAFLTTIALLLFISVVFLLVPNLAQAFLGEVIYKGFVLGFLGWIMSLCGNLLNYALNVFVIGFGDQFNGGVGDVVNSAWATLRDLFNLTFIFGLVYIGFKMILGSDDRSTRKWLINIILAALLVNFSLFISKFVIDFTNIVSVELLNLGVTNEIFVNDDGLIDVSNAMKNQMNIDTVLANDPNLADSAKDNPSFSLIFGTAIVFLVSAFVYIAAAILITIRAAVLVILMIVSPFLFLGMVFPGLMGASAKLWKMLFSRAFFAPVYVALLYICLSVAGGFTAIAVQPENRTFAASFVTKGEDAVTSTAEAFGPFMIIVILMFISLVAAQKMGAEGGSRAVSMGQNLAKRGGKMVARGAGGVAARNVSRGAEVARNRYDRLDRTRTGRALRTVAAVGSLGVLSDKNVRGALNTATKAKVYGSETLDEQRKRRAETGKARSQQDKIADRGETLRDSTADPNKRAAAVRKSTKDELVRLINSGKLTDEMAASITEAQMKELGDSGELNNQQMKTVGEQRNKGAIDNVTNKMATAASVKDLDDSIEELSKVMKGMSKDRKAEMGYDRLRDGRVASNLSDKDIDDLEESGKFSTAQIADIRDAKEKALKEIAKDGHVSELSGSAAASDPGFQEKQRKSLMKNAKDAGKLPAEIFAMKEMQAHVTQSALKSLLENGEHDAAQRAAILTNIEDYITNPSTAKAKTGSWDKWLNTGVGLELSI